MTLTFRCPECGVRYPAPGRRGDGLPQPYTCLGGWPSGQPGEQTAEPVYHLARATVPIETNRGES